MSDGSKFDIKLDKNLSDYFSHDLKIEYQKDQTCRYNILGFGENYQIPSGETPVLSLEKVDYIKSIEVFIEIPLLELQENFKSTPSLSQEKAVHEGYFGYAGIKYMLATQSAIKFISPDSIDLTHSWIIGDSLWSNPAQKA